MTDTTNGKIERKWLREDKLAYLVIITTLILGGGTYALFARVDYVAGSSPALQLIFVGAICALVLLLIFVGRQIWRIWSERRQRMAGSQLHWRLALLFGGITTLPAIIVALFAISVLDFSLRGWFAQRISTAIEQSVYVADAYFDEHSRSVRGQILAMANDVNREAAGFSDNAPLLDDYLNNQILLRNLSEAVIVDGTGQILAKSQFAFALTFTNLDERWIERARSGDVVIFNTGQSNKLRAAVKLNSFVDAYLLVGRFIDTAVLDAVDQTKLAASDYQSLAFRQFDLQISFAVLFFAVTLLLLLSALWIGLNLATSIVAPLSQVISVVDEVRLGNLRPRVGDNQGLDEIHRLGTSIDNMLNELERSREQLVAANAQLDQRREFTETVLGGVSSGVIGLDAKGIVTLPNQMACSLLGRKPSELLHEKLASIIPEFASLTSIIKKKGKSKAEEQLDLFVLDRRVSLRARISAEYVEKRIIGYVVTFDDVTALLNAQRKAAWSDVARRIAHEIKNPLTPIELAADRLSKKFNPKTEKESVKYQEYLSIISRQVGDIGRMVDEFSAFARMPAPRYISSHLSELVEGQIALFSNNDEGVKLSFVPQEGLADMTLLDQGLMRQLMTNLMQNALNALVEAGISDPHITVDLRNEDESIVLSIADNGPGFPEGDLGKLFEPYMTTRDSGTGLGLAIVQKIVDDHNGQIMLSNQLDEAGHKAGALVTIHLPIEHPTNERSAEA